MTIFVTALNKETADLQRKVAFFLADSNRDIIYGNALSMPKSEDSQNIILLVDDGENSPPAENSLLLMRGMPVFRVQLVSAPLSKRKHVKDRNSRFQPHLVVFEKGEWESGSFSDFSDAQYHHLPQSEDEQKGALNTIIQNFDGGTHFTHWPRGGMFGRAPVALRLKGLEAVFENCHGKSVLDVGAAEGIVTMSCAEAGAKTIHAYEIEANRVKIIERLLTEYDGRAEQADIGKVACLDHIVRQAPADGYDMVLYLGLHHHLPVDRRRPTLEQFLKLAKDWFVIRTTLFRSHSAEIISTIEAAGFVDHTSSKAKRTKDIHQPGAVKIYRREGRSI